MKPHRARVAAMQALYQDQFIERDWSEYSSFLWIDYQLPEIEQKFALDIIKGVKENIDLIDTHIKELSENWDFSRLSYVCKAILRSSFFQLKFQESEVPAKVIIDEAIKIAREYDESDSTRFINGILDAFLKTIES
jgi:transcription antitermination protein NusB